MSTTIDLQNCTSLEAIEVWEREREAREMDETRRLAKTLPPHKFEQIVQWQRDEASLPFQEFGWFDIFCHECEGQETSPRPESLSQFAMRVYELGWAVLSVEMGHAKCPKCVSAEPDESTWAAQYRAGNGGRF